MFKELLFEFDNTELVRFGGLAVTPSVFAIQLDLLNRFVEFRDVVVVVRNVL